MDSSCEGISAEGFDGAEYGITTDDAPNDAQSFSGVLGAFVGSVTQMLKRKRSDIVREWKKKEN